MPENIFEQVIDEQGNPQQGVQGGLNTLLEKLDIVISKLDIIIEKLDSTLEVYTESQHARQG